MSLDWNDGLGKRAALAALGAGASLLKLSMLQDRVAGSVKEKLAHLEKALVGPPSDAKVRLVEELESDGQKLRSAYLALGGRAESLDALMGLVDE
jgi:hypothetical protein